MSDLIGVGDTFFWKGTNRNSDEDFFRIIENTKSTGVTLIYRITILSENIKYIVGAGGTFSGTAGSTFDVTLQPVTDVRVHVDPTSEDNTGYGTARLLRIIENPS